MYQKAVTLLTELITLSLLMIALGSFAVQAQPAIGPTPSPEELADQNATQAEMIGTTSESPANAPLPEDTPPPVPPPKPASNVKAKDIPNDAGKAILLNWEASPDAADLRILQSYEIQRAPSANGPFSAIGTTDPSATSYRDAVKDKDKIKLENHTDYYYKIVSVGPGGKSESETFGPIRAKPHWYHFGKTPILVTMLAFTGFLIGFIQLSKRNPDIFLRPIAGVAAIDEAIGRATEMGRPILYILGLGTAAEIATIASFTILYRVAKKTAEYQTDLIVPCNEPVVMTVAQETVRTAYLDAGRPDLYNDDMVFYVTAMQFAYVTAVNGIMLRRETATNFYLGSFYAESLILAETGNIAGSIQIAGTDQVMQLPFFITSCDYTLIGEELYAASAYLGRDPLLLGALKAGDLAKAVIMIIILVGSLLISFDISFIKDIITVKLQ